MFVVPKYGKHEGLSLGVKLISADGLVLEYKIVSIGRKFNRFTLGIKIKLNLVLIKELI